MSQIRRQSIISSLMVYVGFALGFFNTYLFTKEGGFTKEQYGLTGIFIALANLMFSFLNLFVYVFVFLTLLLYESLFADIYLLLELNVNE